MVKEKEGGLRWTPSHPVKNSRCETPAMPMSLRCFFSLAIRTRFSASSSARSAAVSAGRGISAGADTFVPLLERVQHIVFAAAHVRLEQLAARAEPQLQPERMRLEREAATRFPFLHTNRSPTTNGFPSHAGAFRNCTMGRSVASRPMPGRMVAFTMVLRQLG